MRRIGDDPHLVGPTPARRIFLPVAERVFVTESEFRQVRHPQAGFDPNAAAIQRVLRPGEAHRVRHELVGREKTAVAVGIRAELREAGAHEPEVRLRQLDFHLVVAVREDRAGVHGEERLAEALLEVHVIDASKDRAVRPGVLPAELRLVAVGDEPAEGHVDPVAEDRILNRGLDGRLGVAGQQRAGVQKPGAKNGGTETTQAAGSEANHVFHRRGIGWD